MTDKIQSGQNLPAIPSRDWNRFVDAAGQVLDGGISANSERQLSRSDGIIRVVNKTGADLEQGSVCQLQAPAIDERNYERVWMDAVAVSDGCKVPGIAVATIPQNGTGNVMVSGVCWAKVSGTTGEYACPLSGSASLTRNECGSIRIIWAPGSPSELHLVLLQFDSAPTALIGVAGNDFCPGDAVTITQGVGTDGCCAPDDTTADNPHFCGSAGDTITAIRKCTGTNKWHIIAVDHHVMETVVDVSLRKTGTPDTEVCDSSLECCEGLYYKMRTICTPRGPEGYCTPPPGDKDELAWQQFAGLITFQVQTDTYDHPDKDGLGISYASVSVFGSCNPVYDEILCPICPDPPVTITCCPNGLPETMYIRATGGAGSSPCMGDGEEVSAPLTWNAANSSWEATLMLSSGELQAIWRCDGNDGSGMVLDLADITSSCANDTSLAPASADCTTGVFTGYTSLSIPDAVFDIQSTPFP